MLRRDFLQSAAGVLSVTALSKPSRAEENKIITTNRAHR